MFSFIILALIVLSANGFITVPAAVVAGGIIIAIAGTIANSILINIRKEYAPELTPELPSFPSGLTLTLVIICAYGLALPWYGVVYVVCLYVIYLLQAISAVAQMVANK